MLKGVLITAVVASYTFVTIVESAGGPPQLTITPKRVHTAPRVDVNILCKADAPVTHCQFKVDEKDLYDLSGGVSTTPHEEFEYRGAGLDKGECGIVLKGGSLEHPGYVVSCRVRMAGSGWSYAEMTLDNSRDKDVELVEAPWQNVTTHQDYTITNLLLKSKVPLTLCTFTFANTIGHEYLNSRYDLSKEEKITVKNLTLEYFGRGLESGDCGFTFKVKEDDEDYIGDVWVDVGTASGEVGRYFVRLVSARSQEPPVLNVSSEFLKAGERLIATCSVSEREPATAVDWVLGDDVVTNEVTNIQSVDNTWQWPSKLQATIHKFVRTLTKSDNGKAFKCVSKSSKKESRAIQLNVVGVSTASYGHQLSHLQTALFALVVATLV